MVPFVDGSASGAHAQTVHPAGSRHARTVAGGARRAGYAAAAMAFGSAALAGCFLDDVFRTGDDAVRAARPYFDDSDALGRSRWWPEERPVPPASSWPTDGEVAAEAERMMQPVDDLSLEDQRVVVQWSCEVSDAVELYYEPTPENVAVYMATSQDAPTSYRLQIEEIAEDMVEARTTGEEVAIIAQAGMCTWASR